MEKKSCQLIYYRERKQIAEKNKQKVTVRIFFNKVARSRLYSFSLFFLPARRYLKKQTKNELLIHQLTKTMITRRTQN